MRGSKFMTRYDTANIPLEYHALGILVMVVVILALVWIYKKL